MKNATLHFTKVLSIQVIQKYHRIWRYGKNQYKWAEKDEFQNGFDSADFFFELVDGLIFAEESVYEGVNMLQVNKWKQDYVGNSKPQGHHEAYGQI